MLSNQPHPKRLCRNSRDAAFADVTRNTSVADIRTRGLAVSSTEFDLDRWPSITQRLAQANAPSQKLPAAHPSDVAACGGDAGLHPVAVQPDG